MDVPLGRNATGAAKAVLGSWQVSGITRLQSGSPLTVYAPGDIAGIGTGGQRPDLLSDPSGPETLSRWFNTDAFVSPPPLTFGNAGVGIIRGPGISNWDFARTDVCYVVDMRRFEDLEQVLRLLTSPQYRMPTLRDRMTRMRAALKIEHKLHALLPEFMNDSVFRRIEPFSDGPFQKNEEGFVIVLGRELVLSLAL